MQRSILALGALTALFGCTSVVDASRIATNAPLPLVTSISGGQENVARSGGANNEILLARHYWRGPTRWDHYYGRRPIHGLRHAPPIYRHPGGIHHYPRGYWGHHHHNHGGFGISGPHATFWFSF